MICQDLTSKIRTPARAGHRHHEEEGVRGVVCERGYGAGPHILPEIIGRSGTGDLTRRFRSVVRSRSTVVDHDPAALDNDGDIQHVLNQIQRIAVEDDDVGKLTCFQGTDFVSQIQKLRRILRQHRDDIAS